nr:hypothetical protein [Tanacetum cinerariifolium]
MRIDPSKTHKEPTYQVVLDALSLTTCYPAFLITPDVCLRLPNQDFDELPSDEEIVSFIKELGHKGDVKSVTEVVIDHMYQPWRTFAAIINKCLSGKIIVLPKRMTNQQMRESDTYKTYLAATSPKMKRKLKKPDSHSKKRTFVTVEEEEPKPAKKVIPTKKPATKRQSSGVQI